MRIFRLQSQSLRWIGGALAALLVVALGASALLGTALLVRHPDLASLRDSVLLLAHLGIFHGLLLAPVAAGTIALLALLAARRGVLPTPRAAFLHVAAVAATWLLVVNAILRFTISYAPLRGGYKAYATPLSLVNLAVFPVALLVVFALCWAFTRSGPDAPASRRRAGALLGIYLAVLAVTIGANLVAERPERADISGLATPAAGSAPPPAAGPERVLVLGIDGLSWHVIKTLLAQGDLPHFAAMVEQGARANFETLIPTYSPILWNSIATGRHHADHGIEGFTQFRLPGMRGHLKSAPLASSINWVNGLNRALSAAADRGWVEQSPVFSVERRAAALWDIADHHGETTGVFNWLGIWPVTALSPGSFMVSGTEERPGAWHPEDAVRRVLDQAPSQDGREAPDLPGCPGPEPMQDGARLYRHFTPRLALAWTTVDGSQHHFWRGAFDYDRLIRPWRLSHERFAPEILACYRQADAALGTWRQALGPEALVLVVSDHGYSFDGYEHHFAPDGVFLAAGPGVVPGKLLEEVTIYDLAPTVLHALGLPISEELEGRVVEEMFRPGVLPEARRVPAYSWYEPQELEAERSLDVEHEAIEALKELGYVN